MKRVLLFGLIWTTLTVSLADAAPARPLYQPKTHEQAPSPQHELHDSIWEGACFNTPCVIKFKGDGTLQYYSSNRKEKGLSAASPGSWRIVGDVFIFDINKYSEHRGVYCGDIMLGESSNKAGSRGKFSLHRVMPAP